MVIVMYEEISKKIGKKIINGGYRTALFDLRFFKKNQWTITE